MEISKVIEDIGLSNSEALVYINTLKIGVGKASDIAQKSNIKREASYYILKSLQEKGFVSETIKSGVKYYSATPPKRIIELIEEEKARKTDIIKSILPELETLQKTALEKPKIEFYEGSEGLKSAASIMTLEKNQEICAYVHGSILKFMPYFHPQFRRRRKEMNVKLKIITERNEFTLANMKEKDKEELRETRFFDEIIKNLDISYYILNTGILILKANEKEQLGIYIKENSTAKLQKRIFDLLWKVAKK